MSGEGWIAIVGWDELTHPDVKRSGKPLPWVRNHVRLLDDDGYLDLTPGEAAVYHRLLLVYASSHARLRADTRSLSRRLGLRVTLRTLESLNHAGFIRLCASAMQARRWHGASVRDAREEREEEKNSSQVEDVVRPHFTGSPSTSEQETNSTNEERGQEAELPAALPTWEPRPF